MAAVVERMPLERELLQGDSTLAKGEKLHSKRVKIKTTLETSGEGKTTLETGEEGKTTLV